MTERPKLARRRWTKLDPYAISDISREYPLTGTQQHVLLTLALRAGWRSWEWVGTYTDLADATRLSRKAVQHAVECLVNCGLLEVVHPFRQGAEGCVRIVDLDRLASVGHRRQEASDDGVIAGAVGNQIATTSRGNRDDIAHFGAIEQGEDRFREVQRHGGMEVQSHEPVCAICGGLMQGHPFAEWA